MRKFRIPQSRDQIALFPASIEEYVLEEDAVRYVDALVDEFDLSTIEERFSYEGRPAYSPRVLVKILLYGKLRGIRSSRELACACKENMRFIYLAQHERPDFRTISDFRKKHIDLLGELLKQTVVIGIEEGIIDLKHVAVDGTKIRANASGKSFQKPEELQRLLEALEVSLRDDIAREEAEDEKHGDDDGDFKLPQRFQDKKAMRERLRESLNKHQSITEKDRPSRISKTDGDARFMKGPEGKRPYYNGQLAVDGKARMVVGARLSNAGSDHGELAPMVTEIKATCDKTPEKLSADKGFRATEGLVALEENSIEGYVPLQGTAHKLLPFEQFIYDDEEDEYICPEGRTLYLIGEKQTPNVDIYQSENCTGCSRQSLCIANPSLRRTLKVSQDIGTVQRMKIRVSSAQGKAMARARAMTVELAFAWLKTLRKVRQFLLRGLSNAGSEWKFEAVGLNVARLVTERMKLAAQIP